MTQIRKHSFLPVTRGEMEELGWDYVDIVIVTGDAYVDHPAFGAAIIGRILESKGYRVGVVSMPDWKNPDSINIFGRPRIFFGVTGGAIDSMLARYTALKRPRTDNPYSPGGKQHKPERAVIVYCNLIKRIYKDVPIVIGGIEASMRRIAHYDFWDNRVRRSIIEDSRADILVYGMGESQIVEIADRISLNKDLSGIPGTLIISREIPDKENILLLPPEEEVIQGKDIFINLYRLFYLNQHRTFAQRTDKRYLIHYPSSEMNTRELDRVYRLPYMRLPHPLYKERITAFEMIKNSVTCHRGCVSGCSFCSISMHQGRRIISRSNDSVLEEVQAIAGNADFKGHITDIGGPSANMYAFNCSRSWHCSRESCTFPSLCPNLEFGSGTWIDLIEKASCTKRIKRVTVGSGIRYDLFIRDRDHKALLKTLVKSHISGQLKIAPEHTSARVLRAMRKSPVSELREFIKLYKELNLKANKKQYLIPYLMSCHPGCTERDMINLKEDIGSLFGFFPDQVQMFIPLPMTLSSVMYYTGIDPLTDEHFPVDRDMRARKKQHRIFSL